MMLLGLVGPQPTVSDSTANPPSWGAGSLELDCPPFCQKDTGAKGRKQFLRVNREAEIWFPKSPIFIFVFPSNSTT